MGDDSSHLLTGMCQYIIQYFIETITHSLQYSSFDVYMLRQYVYHTLINIIDVLFIENIYRDVTASQWEILLYER